MENKNLAEADHPLLRDYNRLILKAAIEQARKEGATHIMVSDAETAMMTEGHDATRAKHMVYKIAGQVEAIESTLSIPVAMHGKKCQNREAADTTTRTRYASQLRHHPPEDSRGTHRE